MSKKDTKSKTKKADKPKDKRSKLERAFDEAISEVGSTIKKNIEIANAAIDNPVNGEKAVKALKEAIKLADKHGIPFHSNVVIAGTSYVMALENNHVPDSFHDKYGSLDLKKVSKLTDVDESSLRKASPLPLGFDDEDEDCEYEEDELDDEDNF